MTTYAAVIATRNRPDALALSIPTLLAQSRPPTAILVIDSSDDPSANRAVVEGLAARAPLPLRHQVSATVSSSLQRNVGLDQVTADVVLMPDDDSLLWPGAMEAVMRIYDRDTEGRIGGVCADETRVPPEGALVRGPDAEAPAYAMRRSDRLKALVARRRYAIEARLVADPFVLAADRLRARLPPAPGWLADEGAEPAPWMTGFRMSFRTPLIQRLRFDETLTGYGLFEDIDASLRALRTHHVVVAKRALIYHHKAPARRAGGRALGTMHILNRAYVVARTGEADATMRAAVRATARYKILQYAIGARGEFGRERLAGAMAAARRVPRLWAADPADLPATYQALRRECVPGS